VNAGFYYVVGDFKFQLGYGAWMYASQTEHVVDAKVSTRTASSIPSWLFMAAWRMSCLSTRVWSLRPVSLLAPRWVRSLCPSRSPSRFDTDNFHGGDAGFAYVSAGIGATVPLTKQIALSFGVTYYHTQSDVIPNVD